MERISETNNKEYKFMRAEILQYMEEYQTVRNMMYVVTGTILGLTGSLWENYYLFLLPLVVILPSYIIYYNICWENVSRASGYIQIFLESETTANQINSLSNRNILHYEEIQPIVEVSSYMWEGRLFRFSEKYKEKRKKSREILLSHAKAGTYKAEIETWEWNAILAIGIIIITVWIFNAFSRVDIREIKNIWEEVKLDEIKKHSR